MIIFIFLTIITSLLSLASSSPSSPSSSPSAGFASAGLMDSKQPRLRSKIAKVLENWALFKPLLIVVCLRISGIVTLVGNIIFAKNISLKSSKNHQEQGRQFSSKIIQWKQILGNSYTFPSLICSKTVLRVIWNCRREGMGGNLRSRKIKGLPGSKQM